MDINTEADLRSRESRLSVSQLEVHSGLLEEADETKF